MIEPALITAATEVVTSYIKRRIDAPPRPDSDIATRIEMHLYEALRWSQRMQFYGMSRAEETETATIPLRLNVEPRRFRGVATDSERDESDLLNDSNNYLLLGDPGAGKTTTVKRLVQKLLLEQPASEHDEFSFPIVIRLRELTTRESVAESIATAIGIPFEKRTDLTEVERVTAWSGSRRLPDVVAEFLNTNEVVLFLDGLDEVAGEPRRLYPELARLALNARGSKIILSCRSGDYIRVIDGFDVLEICPLDSRETLAIAKAWLGDPEVFLKALSKLPYRDVTDRPLLLTQLLYIYKRYGYLPEQPSQVYRKVVSLLLQEWDAERGIARLSSYAQFDPDRKAAFLAAIAYYLTYKIQAKQFTTSDLESAYLRIRERFRLPREQAAQVIREIETHTGLIVGAANDMFEFTHLSLQEFLCADYLSRDPQAELLRDYLASYPAPVAITVALSSNASNAFAALFLNRPTRAAYPTAKSFLARLLLERPFFEVSAALGIAVMKLYRDVGGMTETRELLDELLTLPSVMDSLSRGLAFYQVRRPTEPVPVGFAHLERTHVPPKAVPFKAPPAVGLPRQVLDQLAARGDVRAMQLSEIARTP